MLYILKERTYKIGITIMTVDYGKTIHLPKTDFPRRGGLGVKEPLYQARWEEMNLYEKQREQSKEKEKFILHMGPPFANGHIHIGHVLSTVLKDVVCRTHQMMGYDAPLIPGFDCHGLPIEWKIEENFRAQGKNNTKDIDPVGFRTACREFAQKWVDVQAEEFGRIGILGDFKKPYITMHKKSEAIIAKEIHKFLKNDLLYRGSKPVMWSIPEQTALAEAEIEYKDITSDTIFVSFPVKETKIDAIKDSEIVIWTTTPWTIPANRAIGFGGNFEYVAIEITAPTDIKENKAGVQIENSDIKGKKFVIAQELLEDFLSAAGISDYNKFWEGKGSDFIGTKCSHPLFKADEYYNAFDVPLLAGDFVTTEAGTGFVHIAPGHGEDDYRLGVKNNIDVPHTVGGDGKYFSDVGLFAGIEVYTDAGKKGPANKLVIGALASEGHLIGKNQIKHSYPHSWRSKAPVIFRNTPQWFIAMDKNDLRKKALAEIEKTRFVPEKGKKRLSSMVAGRSDWCVSRQRAWGVPIAIFVNKETGEALKDEKVLNRIYEIFLKEGSDAWFDRPAQDFLGSDYKAKDYEQIKDIIDVWFESGSTQEFVLEEREELHRPADLYLEGSDQHRGWFQSSLLVGCGTHGNAPYKAILTHGFILDEKGYKMSKSEGNVTSPMKLSNAQGADILRLWVTGSDYSSDIKFGQNILKGHVDIYKRLRGTFCYLLGNLKDFKEEDKIAYDDLSDMDKLVLHKIYEVDKAVRQNILDFDFLSMITTVHNFCSRDLSSFYFDICKDALYCDALDNSKRKAILTVLDEVFNHLVHWLSPILCFTTEEAWLSYKGITIEDKETSIHLSQFPDVPKNWENTELNDSWKKIQEIRSVVNGALEIKRQDKTIGSSLEASPKLYVEDSAMAETLKSLNFADICITSNIEIIQREAPDDSFKIDNISAIAVVVEKAKGDKCERCWKITEEIGSNKEHPSICNRCAKAVEEEIKTKAA